MRKKIRPNETDPKLDMSSLIDVSFLLLIYFIVTSTLDPKEADLGMTLPTEKGGSAEIVLDNMQIELNHLGQVVVNQELLDLDTDSRDLPILMDRLKAYAEAAKLTNTAPIVTIAAHDDTKGQRFIDVLNAVGYEKLKIQNVTLSDFTE
ncbi:MAG: biopolymer transporter ExbD [Verrucomicrobiota bacterium]